MTVYLQEHLRFNKTLAERFRAKLEHTTLDNVLIESTIHYDPDFINSTLIQDRYFLDIIHGIPDPDLPNINDLEPWVLRLTFNREKLIEKDLSIDIIATKILDIFQDLVYITYSDNNCATLVMHIRLFTDPLHQNEENNNIQGNEFLEYFTTDLFENLTISGIPGIEKAFVADKICPVYSEKSMIKEYFIETDGINMKETMNLPEVEPTRIYCNDPQEMLSIFGIEVSREILINEIRSVIEAGGSYINYRHLVLLVEVMTNRGSIMSITRHGINRTDAGALMKCTFEQTVDILLDAAISGEVNEIRGVAEHILLGAVAPIGTGSISILLDTDKLMQVKVVERYNPLKASYLQ